MPSSIADRARNGAAEDPQAGLFDREIEDASLEELLDQREDKRAKKSSATTAFKEKDDLVKARLSEFELEGGEVIRCGKYRITKTVTAPGHREFDVGAGSRLNISLFAD